MTPRILRRVLFLAAASAALSMAMALDARAYELALDPNGHPAKWRSSVLPVTFRIDQDGTPDCADEFNAIRNAYQSWDAASGMRWNYGGTANLSPANWGVEDGVCNNIWCESNWASVTGANANVIAICKSIYVYTVFEAWVLDADILYNGETFTWSSSGEAGKMDVQNIATHEIGHAMILLDLEDAGDSEKTMYWGASSGETKKRTLDPDDIAGAQYLYPLPSVLGDWELFD